MNTDDSFNPEAVHVIAVAILFSKSCNVCGGAVKFLDKMSNIFLS